MLQVKVFGTVNRGRRWILHVVWATLVLLSGCSVPGLSAFGRQPLDLTLLHTGQVYGEILPCG
jgi:hypothetical protein